MPYMSRFLWVCLGGAVGTGARYLIALTAPRLLGTSFPWATLIVNVSGSLLLGVLAVLFLERVPPHQRTWFLLLGVGFCGGYTTFSTFSLDVAVLYERGEIGLAALYVLLSVVLSIGGLFGGLALVRGLT